MPITRASGFLAAILVAFSLASLKLRSAGLSPDLGVSSMDGLQLVNGIPKVFSDLILYLELEASIRLENLVFMVFVSK